ncbi:MAG: hypothetical protein ACI32N_03440, partial [Bulleidia sp.]
KYIRPLSNICVVLEAPPITVGSGGVIQDTVVFGDESVLVEQDDLFSNLFTDSLKTELKHMKTMDDV